MKLLLTFLVSVLSLIYCNGQIVSVYKKGYYIDASNQLHPGLIKFNGVNSFIKFKADKKQKATTIKAEDIIGFVMEKDSFAVVRNFEVPYGFSTTTIMVAFAKVIKAGPVSWYVNTCIVGYGNTSSLIETYLVKKSADYSAIRVPIGQNKFKKVLSDYLSDCPDVSKGILEGRYSDLSTIVQMYNQLQQQTKMFVPYSGGRVSQ